ncbi:BI1-like protein [Melia azedarach]|uniref:BI1-like protein n=1 Tax=Melia azedarach TaxID=155640 RepID=A0ACC1YH48_MELAZ|nr:BI1-like protein [Melia azedarach]
MMEPPQLRWAFIRKVYAIIAMQFLLTAAVAAVVVFAKPIPRFLTTGTSGLAVLIVAIILPLVILCPLIVYRKHHPCNFILLMLFTITISFTLGVVCAFTKGRIILEAALLTAVAVLGLTLYTFWAVKKGKDFSFLGPFLFASILVLIVFGIIKIFFPLGKLAHMIYGLLGAIIFCGYIVYETDKLIKSYTYDEYIMAAIDLCLDIYNFIFLVNVLSAADC